MKQRLIRLAILMIGTSAFAQTRSVRLNIFLQLTIIWETCTSKLPS
jgi:hypothetical protein